MTVTSEWPQPLLQESIRHSSCPFQTNCVGAVVLSIQNHQLRQKNWLPRLQEKGGKLNGMPSHLTVKPCLSMSTGCISRIQFSEDGKLILTLGDNARVWNAESGQPVTPEMGTRSVYRAASLSPDGKLIAVIDNARPKGDRYGVKVWSVEQSPHLAAKLDVESPVFLQFDPSGDRLLVVADTGACVWGLRKGRRLFKEVALENGGFGFSGNFLCAEISPLGDIFVTTRLRNDNCARMWHMDSGEPWARPLVHKSRVQCVAFNEGGNYVVTGSADCTTRVWDTLTGEPVSGSLQHKGQVACLSLSPDLDPLRIATITDGRSTPDVLWEIFADGATGTPLRCSISRYSHCDKFGCVAFDQRGSMLAVANHHIDESHGDGKTGACWWMIDAKTFEPVVPVMQTDWHVREIAFSPDCRKVVAGCGWAYGGGCATVYQIGENG